MEVASRVVPATLRAEAGDEGYTEFWWLFVVTGGLWLVFAFYLLLRGVFEVVSAFVLRGRQSSWWLVLVVGAAQILLAFWAAGDFGHKAFLLVVWVGASALAHGFIEIVRAFELRPR